MIKKKKKKTKKGVKKECWRVREHWDGKGEDKRKGASGRGLWGWPTWYRQRDRRKKKCEVNTLSDGKITKALENYDFSLRLQYRG